MKAKFFLFAFILILLLHNADFCQEIKVNATVIGYSSLARITFIIGRNTAYLYDDVLIRVEQDAGNLKQGQYLRFRYDNLNNTANLPKKMFKKQSLWEFTLNEKKDCDLSMKDLLYYELEGQTNSYITRTPWAKNEDLPLEAKVLCYILNADGYKKL